MSVAGLTFGERHTELCVLDASGQVVEEGLLRSTEAALSQRFAAMPPAFVAVDWHPAAAHLIELLSKLGHSVLLAGRVDARLLPALEPAAATAAKRSDPGPVVIRRAAGAEEPEFALSIELGASPDSHSIADAWYFAGPVTAVEPLSSMAGRSGVPVAARTRALKAFEFVATGEIAAGVRGYRTSAAA